MASYADDGEIIARTILREAFEKGQAAYNSVAWVIYNRVKSGSFPNTGRGVCLQKDQFAVWRDYWGKANIPLNPSSTSHRDYGHCLTLSNQIQAGRGPTTYDPTSGAVFFLTHSSTVEKNHPGGTVIGGNYFFHKW
jgi:hypothetical protein